MSTGRSWSPEDDEMLRTGFASGKSDREIGEMLTARGCGERSGKSVKQRRSTLRLLREVHDGVSRSHGQLDSGGYWTSQALATAAFSKALRAAGVKETTNA